MVNWKELESQYYMKVFSRLPIVLVRGEGMRVWDENGKSYLDLVAGLAVNVLGHVHPKVTEAICKQAKILVHTTNLYHTMPQLELAKLLVENSCADRVFFGNSGAEANEGAIKLARKYGRMNRGGAYEVISTHNSFHGRTLATIAATGQEKFQKPFLPMPDGFKQVPYNDLDAMKAATTEKTAAVLIEIVQGESGVHPADHDYVVGLREWCDQQGLLMMLDEIQTGLGRTGKFLAYELHGIKPDVFTMAKGLAGGVPIGAVLATEKASVFELSDHGSTFGGNPLATAAGVATVNTIFEEGLIDNAAKVGAYAVEKAKALKAKHDVVDEIRGVGLMIAFDLKRDIAAPLVRAALAEGVILNNTSAKTIRMIPPLIVTKSDMDEAFDTIDRLLPTL
jgi:acetylornithine/N-succinyldiaminopimelate aminotransferase